MSEEPGKAHKPAVPTPEEAAAEVVRLRRGLRDLVALAMLPAFWIGREPAQIAGSVADALLRTLRADLIYIRLKGLPGLEMIEVARASMHPTVAGQAQEIGHALAPWFSHDAAGPGISAPDPLGPGTLRLIARPLGFEGKWGDMVVCARRPDFPSDLERMLLSVGINQTTISLQEVASQAALRRSQQELDDFFENGAVGLHWMDPNGAILRANQALLEMLGYTREEYIGHHFAEFHVIPEALHDIFRRLLIGETVRDYAVQLRCKDGAIKQILIDANVLWEEDRFLYSRCFLRDVTARQRVEMALRASETRYRQLSEELELRINERTAELTRTVEALNAEVIEREQAERTSRTQADTLIRTLEQLTEDNLLEEFPATVLAAGVDQIGADSGSLWGFDDVTEIAQMAFYYEDGQLHRIPDLSARPMPRMIDHHNTAGWQEMKALLLRGECYQASFAEEISFLDPDTRAYLEARNLRMLFVVPLLLHGRLLGYCRMASRREEKHGHRDLELVQALARQTTLAMQWTRLSEQARQTAVLDERNRMAREIHDTLAQAFTGILMQLGNAERLLASDVVACQTHLQSIRDLAREGLSEARRSVKALRPQTLESTDLAGALDQMVQLMNSDLPPRLEFHLYGVTVDLPTDVANHLLRIGQEALTNALRHARANTIQMELAFADAETRLSVEDDGQGFEANTPGQRAGFGLTGMRERVGILGAELTVTSALGRGTRIEVRWQAPGGASTGGAAG
ncbi:MAG: putative signal transduction histidine kinase [Chthonomonadaceae bacterium]|nr:putative signal transduction histidine kinase [Chthonomonadaceae bacterium]